MQEIVTSTGDAVYRGNAARRAPRRRFVRAHDGSATATDELRSRAPRTTLPRSSRASVAQPRSLQRRPHRALRDFAGQLATSRASASRSSGAGSPRAAVQPVALPAARLQRLDETPVVLRPGRPSMRRCRPRARAASGRRAGRAPGITSCSRFVQSPPRQTRSGPEHRRSVLQVVDHAVDRRAAPGRSRAGAASSRARRRGRRARATARRRGCAAWSLTARQPACVTQTRPSYALEALVEEPRRGVGEIQHRRRARRSAPSSAASEPGEAALLGGAVCVRVAAVPRQPRHRAARAPRRDRPSDARSRTARRPRARAAGRSARRAPRASRSARVAHGDDAVAGSRRSARGRRSTWRERLAQRSLRLVLELDEDRADLQPDAAGLEQRQPRPREDVRLAEPVLPVCELEQQVAVGVRDHARSILSAVDLALALRGSAGAGREARLAAGGRIVYVASGELAGLHAGTRRVRRRRGRRSRRAATAPPCSAGS